MGILMKAFVCLSLLLFCSYIKASARVDNPIYRRSPDYPRSPDGSYHFGPPQVFHRRPCSVYYRCPPDAVGKQVVDNKPAKKSVVEPQGRSGYNGGLP
ncbi:unnamed protein product [Amaranthus hypochondriacus]